MTREEFIKLYGMEDLKATPNYVAKSIGNGYAIKDAIIEFCDNAWDARYLDKELHFIVEYNKNHHILTIKDDGQGIDNADSLFTLGGTDKETDATKIGKYGIGVPGATSAIAMQCRFNKNENVEIIYNSKKETKEPLEKHIIYTTTGDLILGETHMNIDNSNDHYTKITITNVEFTEDMLTEIIEAMDETFEEPLARNHGLRIQINHRNLGETFKPTFTKNTNSNNLMVGKFKVIVKDCVNNENRTFSDSGIRIYDAISGRLLAKDLNLWKWYGDKEAQQNICGLKVAIYIESSIECYNMFGIKAAKNGVNYKKYCKLPEFQELSEKLSSIYNKVAGQNSGAKKSNSIKVGNYEFITRPEKEFLDVNENYKRVENSNIFFVNKKITIEDFARLIVENIKLKEKLNRKGIN